MKSVSTAFLDRLKDPNIIVTKEVSYKRRYWVQSSSSFVWEGDWTILAEKEIVRMSAITGKLDNERLNEFKISNVTLIVKNNENQWKDSNSSGKFGSDSVSPTYPYIPYWTKFRIRALVKLYDGTTEGVTLFTGLATDYQTASDDQMQITVQGLESLLIKGKAENVSTRVVNENVGTANGILTEFSTAFTGVGIIEEISVGGIEQRIGTIVTISQLNEVSLGAKATFAIAPASGIVRITYRYWKQDRTVESLVADLATEAGISGLNQNIESVIFPSGISNLFSVDSQSEWGNATSLTDLDSITSAGDIFIDVDGKSTLLDDFSDGEITSNPVWTKSSTNATGFEVAANLLRCFFDDNAQTKYAHTPQTSIIGEWKFDNNIGTLGPSGGNGHGYFAFIAAGFSNSGPLSAYAIKFTMKSSQRIQIVKTDASGNPTILAQSSSSAGYSAEIKVTRKANGEISLYADGVLLLTATDTTITTSTVMGLYFKSVSNPGVSGYNEFDNFYSPDATITGEYHSETFDAGASVSVYGRLIVSSTLTLSGAITWFTRTSTDGISWDAWEEISETGQINSLVKRYIQVKGEFEQDTDDGSLSIAHSYELQYSATTTTIVLADFTGKTCYEAIQALGTFANYEWGFTADETFFFRSKVVNKVANFTLSRNTNIKNITNLTNGYDKVFTEVKATYGNFEAVVKASRDHINDPSLRYGDQVLELSDGGILISEDADIAQGIAAIFFAAVSRPKKRFKAQCKYMPYVDLSDVGLISFDNFPQKKQWYWGDKNVYLGQTDIYFIGPESQLINAIDGFYGKVMGYRHDPDMKFSEFDFEEVL